MHNYMSKKFISVNLLLGTFLILLMGCKKEEEFPLFEIESIGSIMIPAGLNTVETHYINIHDLTSTLGAQLETRGMTLDDLSVIKPQSFVMTSLDGDVDFNFIARISSDIFTKSNPNSSEIFFMEPVPLNTRSSLVLFPSLLNVKDYFKESSFSIEVKFNVRGFSTRNVEARIDMVFQAHE